MLLTIVPEDAPSSKLKSAVSAVTPDNLFNSNADASISVPDILNLDALTSPLIP